MTNIIDTFDQNADILQQTFNPERLAYIKPTDANEARRLGIIPPGIEVPDGTKLFVLHGVDGRVLGFTDAWESAYGAALQNELTPLSVH